MKKNITKKLLMATFIVMIMAACGSNNSSATSITSNPVVSNTEVLQLTKEELAKYDGKNGNKAYVAVDGVIYDFTPLGGWKEGEHNGFKAGTDLSEDILKAPHGKSTLEKATIVGELVE